MVQNVFYGLILITSQDLSASVQPHDRVQLTIRAPTMNHEIWLPFMTPDQLTPDRVMMEVEHVIQSNDDWIFGDFFINYIHAPLPFGGGLLWGVGDLTTFLTKKASFSQIPRTADNLCCA